MPRVSVVTPFLNSERYLEAAIESVRSQTYSDWELLLVDDGSSDDSGEIAARLAKAEPGRIRLLQPDLASQGAAAARNRGIAAARGALIAFLDADDLYLPEKLASDVAALDADPGAAWVYGATRWFFDDRSGRDWVEQPGVPRDRSYAPPKLLIRTLLRERGDVPCTCAVLVRKEVIDKVGGFEERFALYEDQTLWAKLLLGWPVRVRSGCDALYRQHPASTTVAATEQGRYDAKRPHRARRDFLEWLQAYCVEQRASPDVLTAVSKSLSECAGGPVIDLKRRLRRFSRYLPLPS